MTVSQKPFGHTREGQAVTAYRLENRTGAHITVLDYGATLQSLVVRDKNGRLTDVVMGYDSISEYEENDGYLGATIGRVSNRIGAARFSLNGRDYPLAKNDGENHLHGGLRGFDKQMWSVQTGSDFLSFSRLSPDGEEGYPGNLRVSVCYSLTESGELFLRYEAVSDADTPLSLTNHSYVNLSGNGDVEGHILKLFSERFLENDSGCLPTGKLLDVAGTAFDFRQGKPLGLDIGQADAQLAACGGYDHCYLLLGRTAAVLQSPDSGIEMTVYTTAPAMQLYTANFLTPRPGKSGKLMLRRSGVCLETQLPPNAVNTPAFPSPVLKAGKSFKSETCFRFRTI